MYSSSRFSIVDLGTPAHDAIAMSASREGTRSPDSIKVTYFRLYPADSDRPAWVVGLTRLGQDLHKRPEQFGLVSVV